MKLKTIIILSIITAGFFTACSEWTEPEALPIENPSIETENPALYQQYLENLRNYKKTYHQLVVGFFDNSNKSFVSRAMHIEAIPDKVDIVSLMYGDSLTSVEISEIESLRNQKGTKVIYTIDYDAIATKINTAIKDAQDAAEAAAGDEDAPEVIVPEFFDLLEQELNRQFSLLAKYNYDGLCLSYVDFSTQYPTVVDVERITRTQELLFTKLAGVSANAKLRLFAGAPENVLDKSLLNQFDYIIVQTLSAVDIRGLDVIISTSLQPGVPGDRIMVAALPFSLDPSDTKTGVFADASCAITGVAAWLKTPGLVTKAGLAIYRINDDYHNPEIDYKYTREAIEIINPSPKN
jgi:uncharacterized protein (UPF0333 family)